MTMRLSLLIAPLLLLAACQQPAAQEAAAPANTASNATAGYNAAQKAYAQANARMHAGMGNIPADADAAFMTGMIPHHQGAVDMAKIVLQHGKDPEVRALAKTVIATQEAEIRQMQDWLAARPKTASAQSATPVDHSKMGH